MSNPTVGELKIMLDELKSRSEERHQEYKARDDAFMKVLTEINIKLDQALNKSATDSLRIDTIAKSIEKHDKVMFGSNNDGLVFANATTKKVAAIGKFLWPTVLIVLSGVFTLYVNKIKTDIIEQTSETTEKLAIDAAKDAAGRAFKEFEDKYDLTKDE